MVILGLIVLGLVMGSFVNALVWRLHEQENPAHKPNKAYKDRLSIVKGRSMCPNCHHELSTIDLIPVISWLTLKGKCRYCGQPIPDSPLIELALPGFFVASYLCWPYDLHGTQVAAFAIWLILLVGLNALTVYDLRWQLLPNRLMFPLGWLAGLYALIQVGLSEHPLNAFLNVVAAVAVGGGLFYVLFQLSNGKWIGGGDVKLGALLGLILGTPALSFLFIFLAAALGSLVSLPLLFTKMIRRSSTIPFGPFLIIAAIITQLFGRTILSWYSRTFLSF